jgi:hypothetical protein
MDPQRESSEPVRVRAEATPTRPGLVVGAALLTELVVIAAIGNQWVTPKLFRAIINERSHLVSDFKAALVTYNWRFVPEQADTAHIWLSQVLLILTTLVLTAAFVAVIVRGPATFGRVFLTCWLAVTVATVVGAYARGLTNETLGTSTSRLQRGLFSTLGPNTITVFSGLVLGLLVGVVAATVTVVSRDRAALGPKRIPPDPVEAPYVPPEQPPPFFPEPASARPRPVPTAESGAQFPRLPDDDDLANEHHD